MADVRGNQPMSDTVLYSAEDAQHILQIAIARDTESGELSRSQLAEIAEELGISPQTLLEAEQEWEIKRYELADQRLFDRQRRDRFHHNLNRFLIVGAFLIGLKLVFLGWLTPILYIVLGPWALKLAWTGWNIYRPNQYAYTKEFERWRRKRQIQKTVKGVFSWFSSAHYSR